MGHLEPVFVEEYVVERAFEIYRVVRELRERLRSCERLVNSDSTRLQLVELVRRLYLANHRVEQTLLDLSLEVSVDLPIDLSYFRLHVNWNCPN